MPSASSLLPDILQLDNIPYLSRSNLNSTSFVHQNDKLSEFSQNTHQENKAVDSQNGWNCDVLRKKFILYKHVVRSFAVYAALIE